MALMARFIRQAAVMMTGTALAQAIPLLAAPLLTRLYSPEQFGAFSAVVAASAIAAIVASFRYELAILLPEREAEAINLAAFAFGCAVLISLLLVAAGVLFPDVILASWKNSGLLWEAAGLLTFAMAITQILNLAATRERRFRWIASSLVAQQALAVLVAIAVAYAAPFINGLVAGRVVGQLGAAVMLVLAVMPWVRAHARSIQFDTARRLAATYRQFPKFNVPYSFLGTFSRELLILAFTALGHAAAAGQYGLARSVLMAPIGFLSSSLSQVFYREATGNLGTAAFRQLTVTMLASIGAALAPLFLLAWLWAPAAFEMIFGTPWREAGEYATILMPIVFLSLFTSWPERVFEVSGKQRYSLAIQLVFDGLSIVAVLVALWFGVSTRSTIMLYVSIQVAYHLTYLAAVFRLSKLSLRLFGGFLLFLAALVFISAVVLAPMTHMAKPTFQWLVPLAVLALGLGAVLCLATNRLAKVIPIAADDSHAA